MPSKCRFWNCEQAIRSGHTFCYKHYTEAEDGLIDPCPYCHRGKYVQYDSCLACGSRQSQPARNNTRASSPSTSRSNRPYKPEYSPSWEAGDAEAFEFYVYILKLSNNEFYVGQTRDLRIRLSEHRDNKTKSTSGRNPELVWFVSVPTREEATDIESQLKLIRDKNDRLIRRIIMDFQDIIKEVKPL